MTEQFNAKARFAHQVVAADGIADKVRQEVRTLEGKLAALGSDGKDSDTSHKLECLKAKYSVYTAVKKLLRARDVAMDQRFDEAEDESDEKQQLTNAYERMTRVMAALEASMLKLLGVPDSWFGAQFTRLKTWAASNPKTVKGIVAVFAGLPAACGPLYNHLLGHCAIWWIWHWITHLSYSWSLGVTSAVCSGGGIILAAGVIALLTYFMSHYVTYYHPSEYSSQEVERARKLIRQMETTPDPEMIEALDALLESCSQKWPAETLDIEDRKCVICLKEDEDVQSPVQAPGCRGKHFMCKACWLEKLTRRGDACPVCNV